MKKLFFLLIIPLCMPILNAQIILKENFDYPLGDLTNNETWVAYASGGVEAVQVVAEGLDFEGYNFSDTDGKAIKLNPTKQGTEDVYTLFSERVVNADATLYLAFLLKVDETIPSTNMNPQHFLQLRSSTRNTARARLTAIETSSETYKLRLIWGLSQDNPPRETTKQFNYGETYLIVLKYQRGPSGTQNQDVASLYTFDSAPPFNEPSTPDIAPFGAAGTIDPMSVDLQQLGPTSDPATTTPQNMTIDGMVAALSWRDIFREGQPVQNFNDMTVEVGSEPITFDGYVKSGNSITYSIEEGKESVAVLNGNVLTIVGEGSVKITATAEGTDDYMEAEKTITIRVVAGYDWLIDPTIAVVGNNVRVTGPGAERFTKIYVNGVESTDLTNINGEITLRATTSDESEVIRLVISR